MSRPVACEQCLESMHSFTGEPLRVQAQTFQPQGADISRHQQRLWQQISSRDPSRSISFIIILCLRTFRSILQLKPCRKRRKKPLQFASHPIVTGYQHHQASSRWKARLDGLVRSLRKLELVLNRPGSMEKVDCQNHWVHGFQKSSILQSYRTTSSRGTGSQDGEIFWVLASLLAMAAMAYPRCFQVFGPCHSWAIIALAWCPLLTNPFCYESVPKSLKML